MNRPRHKRAEVDGLARDDTPMDLRPLAIKAVA